MKRPLLGFLAAALLGLLGWMPTTARAQIRPGPVAPQLVPPLFFPGFEPIPPDRFGTSPTGEFLVVLDGRDLRVLRRRSGATVFSAPLQADDVQVGFDPFDQRLYFLERTRFTLRLRFVRLTTGQVLLDERFTDEPELFTNLDGSVNVLALRRGGFTRIITFNQEGLITYRRSFSGLVRWGVSLEDGAVAFLDGGTGAATRVELVHVPSGAVTLREQAFGHFEAGFEPEGSIFVWATAQGPSSFRVRLVQSRNGFTLLHRTFTGPLNVGFTPDGNFFGVFVDRLARSRLLLFRTRSGRVVR